MSTVTATILIGSGHPNDNGVNPHLLLKLWEGDRATWTAHALADPTFERRVQPKAPEDIAADGAQLVMSLAREFDLNAVAVCVMEKSSLLGHEKQLAAQPVIEVPTLGLFGDANGVAGPCSEHLDRAKFSQSYDARVLADVGHNIPLEAPEVFAGAALELLQRNHG